MQKEDKNKLDGTWFFDTERIYDSQFELGLCFDKDTICELNNDDYVEYANFQIINDTIIFKDDKEQTQKYIIKKHTNDSLILLINGKERRLHNEKLEFNDILKFNKITIVVGKEINPLFFIILDSLGNVFAEERVDKDRIVKKNFKLISTELNMIDSLLKFSCIDKTDTIGWDGWVYDGLPKSIKFEYNNKSTTIQTKKDFFPYRIAPIYYHIMVAVMNKDTILNKTTNH